jgi:hypothetical protein
MCTPRKNKGNETSIRKFSMNLKEPVPAGTKIKHIATNLWIRASKLQDCCGHPGQAGC